MKEHWCSAPLQKTSQQKSPSHQLWAVYETSRPWSAHGNKAHHSQPFRQSCNLRQVHTNLRHVAWNTRDCHHASLPWDQGKVYRCHISWRQCNYQVRAWLILTKFIEQESGSGTLTPPETETNAQWQMSKACTKNEWPLVSGVAGHFYHRNSCVSTCKYLKFSGFIVFVVSAFYFFYPLC